MSASRRREHAWLVVQRKREKARKKDSRVPPDVFVRKHTAYIRKLVQLAMRSAGPLGVIKLPAGGRLPCNVTELRIWEEGLLQYINPIRVLPPARSFYADPLGTPCNYTETPTYSPPPADMKNVLRELARRKEDGNVG